MNNLRLFLCAVLLLLPLTTFGADYDGPFYVSPDGDDSGVGSIDDPWASFAYPAGPAPNENGHTGVRDGHTIFIQAGIYYETLEIDTPGLTWHGLGNVIIDAQGIRDNCINVLGNGDSTRLYNFTCLNANVEGLYITAAEGCLVDRCIVDSATKQCIKVRNNSHGTIIKNCVIRNSATSSGVHILSNNSAAGANAHIKIYNCLSTGHNNQGFSFQSSSYFRCFNNIAYDNGLNAFQGDIIYSPTSTAGFNSTNASGTYNNWPEAWKTNDVTFDGNIEGYHHKSNAVCINAGSPTIDSVTEDIDGNARPFGDVIDIGAHEYSLDTRESIPFVASNPGNEVIVYDWITGVDGSIIVSTTPEVTGELIFIAAIPSPATPPENNYDLKILDADGLDVLAGNGVNLSSSSIDTINAATMGAVVNDRLRLSITNAGAGRAGKVKMVVE